MPRSRRKPVRRRALSAGAAVVIAGSLAAGSAGAQEDDYPRVLRIDASQPPQVELEAIVPPLLARQTLPASAFQVTENGRPLRVDFVTRQAPANLRVILVLDTAVAPEVLIAEQGAAREFAFRLPAQAEVGVVAADPEPDVAAALDTDRGAAIRAMVSLKAQRATSTNDVTSALGLALTQLPPGPGLNVVVAVDSRPVATAIPAAVSRAVKTTRATIYPIALQQPPLGYLGDLPAGSGGRVVAIDDPGGLLSAYDVVANELQGRYRVGFATTASGSHTAELTVRSAGVQATTAFVFNSGVATTPDSNRAAGGSDPSTRNRSGIKVTRVLAGLLVFTLLVILTWRLAHRS